MPRQGVRHAIVLFPTFVSMAPQQDFTGRWQAWLVNEAGISKLDSAGINAYLDLKADGTFEYHLKSNVMSVVLVDAKGTFHQVRGSVLALKGTQHSHFDDGYRKSNVDVAFVLTLHIDDRTSISLDDPNDKEMVYRRASDGPPIRPAKPKARPSDPVAINLLRRIEAHYASLRSYADEGTVVSNGDGFQPREVRFTTRFVAPKGFRFEATSSADYAGRVVSAVWMEAGKAWLYSSDSGPVEPRPLGNGLGILDVSCGEEATLVPTLLMPGTLGARSLSGFREIHAEPDEHGQAVVELWRDGKRESTLWIDRRTLLIREVRLAYADERILYEPRANVAIPPRELLSKHRKKPPFT